MDILVQDNLNYRMMVERYSNIKEEVGGSIVGCEISSLLDEKLAMRSTSSCALALAYQPFVSRKERKKKYIRKQVTLGVKIVSTRSLSTCEKVAW